MAAGNCTTHGSGGGTPAGLQVILKFEAALTVNFVGQVQAIFGGGRIPTLTQLRRLRDKTGNIAIAVPFTQPFSDGPNTGKGTAVKSKTGRLKLRQE